MLIWFTRQKKWINEKHIELCRIPAPTFQEQKRAEWIAAQFRDLGCETKIDRAGNVIALPRESYDGPVVALTAHLDTVIAPRNPEDISLGMDGKIHGPGVSDNGTGLVALLAIAHAFASSPLLGDAPLPLAFIANVGEEGEGNLSGMRYLCRAGGFASRVNAFLILDGPGTDHITSRALASRRFEVTVTGPGGHSWSDYGVGNPVHAISRAIALFTEHQSTNIAAHQRRASFNFGTIDGGTSINSIPTSARAKVDIRSESPQRIEDMATLLTASVERAIETENDRAVGGKVSAKIREIGCRPAGELPESAPILRHLGAVDAHLNIRARLDCASTDANLPLSLGMQAVSIGAGGHGAGAHTPTEWYHPDGRELGLQRVLLTLLLLMRDIDPAAGKA
jgi:acetylornithine deacetylase/succinyl-diaminopimelate desuccinylase-like protein